MFCKIVTTMSTTVDVAIAYTLALLSQNFEFRFQLQFIPTVQSKSLGYVVKPV